MPFPVPPGLPSGKGACPQQAVSWARGLSASVCPPFPCEGPWLEAQLRKARAGPPAITDVQHGMLSPPPHSSGRPERGVHMLPNIWTSQRAKMHHPDVFKAPCWVSAERDTWVEVKAFVKGERVNFVQRLRVVLAQSWG